MVDKICEILTNKIKKEMPDIDEERAEIIDYGIHIIIGEIPKTFLFLIAAYLLGIFKWFLIGFLVMMPYRVVSGGFHLKTHIGCIVGTMVFYFGNVYASQYLIIENSFVHYGVIFATWLFGMIMVKLYAPADTENVPIISKKERKKKKILSYLALTISLIVAVLIKDAVLSNLIVYGSILQSISISRLAYKLTNNKYGYEIYNASTTNA